MGSEQQQVRRWCAQQKGAGRNLSVRFGGLDALSLSMTFSRLETQSRTQLGSLHSLAAEPAGPVVQTPGVAPPTGSVPLQPSLVSNPGAVAPRDAVVAAASPISEDREDAQRYEVMHALHGGMGVVYICYDHELDFAFAIKTFRQDAFVDRADMLLQFLREIEIWTELRPSSNIVRAYGTRLIGRNPFLFLEFSPGQNLRQLLDTVQLAPADVVEGGQMIARALKHVWSCSPGLVHGDLKPSNILVEKRIIKVTDFGLARSTTDEGGRVAGTPAYMSPEQWRGDPLSPKTDVYALGLLMYEMLVGRRPFEADSLEAYKEAHLQRDPPALQLEDPWQELAVLIAACLRKEPFERPPLSMVIAALQRMRRPREAKHLRDFGDDICHYFGGERTWQRIQGALGFGEKFTGVDEAIAKQLDQLSAEPDGGRLLERLRSLSKLRERNLGAFRAWTARGLDLGWVTMRGRALDNVYLPEVNLAGKDLAQTRLQGAVLAGADLRGADLRGADLRGADLRSAQLAGADLRGARLEKARLLDADLGEADLRGAQLADTVFERARLAGARMDGLRLVGCTLAGCDLSAARLVGAQLRGVALTGARLDGADLSQCQLQEVRLAGMQLRRVRLRESDLSGSDLHGCRLEHCDLQGARLERAVLVDARLHHSSLRGARLESANLRRCLLVDVDARDAVLHGAQLEDARCDDVDFRGAELSFLHSQGMRSDAATRWPAGFVPGGKRPGHSAQGLRIEWALDHGQDSELCSVRLPRLWVCQVPDDEAAEAAAREGLRALAALPLLGEAQPAAQQLAAAVEPPEAAALGNLVVCELVDGQLAVGMRGRARLQRLRDGKLVACGSKAPWQVVTPCVGDVFVLSERAFAADACAGMPADEGLALLRHRLLRARPGATMVLFRVLDSLNHFNLWLSDPVEALAFDQGAQLYGLAGGQRSVIDTTGRQQRYGGLVRGRLMAGLVGGQVLTRDPAGCQLIELRSLREQALVTPARVLRALGSADGAVLALGLEFGGLALRSCAQPDAAVEALGFLGSHLLSEETAPPQDVPAFAPPLAGPGVAAECWRKLETAEGPERVRAAAACLGVWLAQGSDLVALGPGGASLLFARGAQILLVDRGGVRRYGLEAGSQLERVVFSPCGTRWAARSWCDGESRIHLFASQVDPEMLLEARCSRRSQRSSAGPLLFADGARWLAGALGSRLQLWDLSGRRAPRLIEEQLPVTRLAFSPEADQLAWADGDGNIGVWYLEFQRSPSEHGG